ncbi:MAG: hypothetical protein WC707_00160 [Candidatus Babeliaceae bacterium]|jgi:hypothetical protein
MTHYTRRRNKNSYIFPAISAAVLCGLFIFTLYQLFTTKKTINDQLIAQQVHELASIFKRINDTCHITKFKHEKNYIDFLNTRAFEGSEVGPMVVMFPKKWQGPYLHDNFTIQDQYYQILNTKYGYFIVPGDGVKLSNNKIIGKDIILNHDTDIPAMINDKNMLLFENKPLAAPIDVKTSVITGVVSEAILDMQTAD